MLCDEHESTLKAMNNTPYGPMGLEGILMVAGS